MFHFFNKNKDTIGLFLLIIIFGSGFAIYGYNKINGVDLTTPVEIDWSDFDLPPRPVIEKGPDAIIYFTNHYRQSSGNDTIAKIRNDLQEHDSIKNLFVDIITEQDSEYIAKIDCKGACRQADLDLLKVREGIVIK
jgi:hypothetical protein